MSPEVGGVRLCMGRKGKLRKRMRKRGIEDETALVICVGKRCCKREVSRALVEEARAYVERGHLHVPVVTVGCLEVCKNGPIAATFRRSSSGSALRRSGRGSCSRSSNASRRDADGDAMKHARHGSPCRPASRAAPERAREVPEELPITARVVDIANAIDAHQVVIVAGETGSGKTTQLPKICLAMGRGAQAQIGCTQPRRIAATQRGRARGEELGTQLGDVVGYQIRFNDKVKRDLVRQVHDRRHPARRDPGRSAAARLRHDHHRRGPRAQPQHRLPARLPEAAAAAAGRTCA